jgi:quinol monooxygenase YgiN
VRSLGRWSRLTASSSGVSLLVFACVAILTAHDGVGRLAVLAVGVYLLQVGLTGRAEQVPAGFLRTIASWGHDPSDATPVNGRRPARRRARPAAQGSYDDARMFALAVRFDLRPGSEMDFDRLVEATAPRIRANEPGTLLYLCHKVQGEPTARLFYELYRDRAAFEAHEAQPHVKTFLRDREQYMAQPARVEFLDRHDGKGWPAE